VQHLSWPFFDAEHRDLAGRLADLPLDAGAGVGTVEEQAVACVRQLGVAGLLRFVVPAPYGGERDPLDVRSLCLIREALAYRSGLLDFAFAMQGLGTGALTLFGKEQQKQKYLPPVARGEKIAAFAISERNAGSDVAAMECSARRDGADWVINGAKTWISNAGIADYYTVFCRLPELGERKFGAFVVEADTPGLSVTERINVIAPHVLGSLQFSQCRVGSSALIGETGAGLRIALSVLDVFRTTVAAAALGFARRALSETIRYTSAREQFGKPLSEQQLTQARIADMALAIDAAALLVYRAAGPGLGCCAGNSRGGDGQVVFDGAGATGHRFAVQLHGGRGVVVGEWWSGCTGRFVRCGSTRDERDTKLVIAGHYLQSNAG
jgi:acyl-CoA dehydrogenase